MESYGNEIRVQQGEDWNLDMLLSASNIEYIPYLVSSERVNPYFVITVASTKYEKNLRYVKSWWCSIKDSEIPTFYSTVPVYHEINDPTELENLTPADCGDSEDERYLYYYTVQDETGKILEKHYFYFDYSGDDPVLKVDEYECHIRMNFASKDTAEWGSQNYLYQITLVSGQLMADRLEEIRQHYNPENWPTITIGMTDEQIQETIEAQYKYVKANYPGELQPDIDIDSPLGYIDTPEVILQPTKLEVYNNLRKLI